MSLDNVVYDSKDYYESYNHQPYQPKVYQQQIHQPQVYQQPQTIYRLEQLPIHKTVSPVINPTNTSIIYMNSEDLKKEIDKLDFPDGIKYTNYPTIDQIGEDIVYKGYEKIRYNEIYFILENDYFKKKLIYKEEIIPVYIVTTKENFSKWLEKNEIMY